MRKKSSGKSGFDEFTARLSKGELGPVLVFTGADAYFTETALRELRNALLGPEDDINYVLFYGESASGKEIADTASTYPMFSKKKLVVVKNADKLGAKELPPLEAYIESPSPVTTLVLVFPDSKKPKLGGGKSSMRFDFSPQKGNAVSAVREQARELGYEITKAGADMLISLVGEDMQEINSELRKIALYKGEAKTIGPEEIENMTRKTSYADIYQLINAISNKDKRAAHRVLTELEAAGEEPLSILGLINWRFRLIWRAKELVDCKKPREAVIKELRISPGQFYYLSNDLKKFTYKDIVRIMGAISECDRKLKLSYVPKSFVLTRLVLELCARN